MASSSLLVCKKPKATVLKTCVWSSNWTVGRRRKVSGLTLAVVAQDEVRLAAGHRRRQDPNAEAGSSARLQWCGKEKKRSADLLYMLGERAEGAIWLVALGRSRPGS